MTDVTFESPRVNGESPVPQGRQLWGAAEIGAAINRSPRKAIYLLSTGGIKSARKVGGLWTCNETALRREFGGETA